MDEVKFEIKKVLDECFSDNEYLWKSGFLQNKFGAEEFESNQSFLQVCAWGLTFGCDLGDDIMIALQEVLDD